ncbi:hypothetical protein KP509_14G017100 [Ceratopteris richardii]|uniref:B-block binding subunit of TFIIIC domain-containing protein n=2 Tax=Ceratopteris richardii TaxID=49495 RepID=A0A8T2T874_CERRI|nr:hypothetical protein KP509_14G017100 [Ceratopteris richardii]
MDALVAVVLEEVAAEGEQGCSLPDLWKWLEASSSKSGLLLDPALKQALWKQLISSNCLTFKGRSFTPLAATEPSIQSYEDAERLEISIVPSEDLRDSFLGIYDVRHSDSKLSTEQRRMLERIGRARANGITQYEIGKEFGISGNKLFYVIKNLESRGLLVRQSSIFRGERPIATNLIHLKRFAKAVKLGTQQRFEIQKTSLEHGRIEGIVTEGSGHDGAVKGVLVNDDLPALKAICKKLEEAPTKVLVIADLKVNLGFRLTRGHREWRRLLSRLLGAGIVEVFEANVENKVLPCIRLSKPFDPKAFISRDSRGNLDQTESDRSTRGTKRGQITEQVAELSINRQIYDIIKQGGPEGVPVTEIFTSLGLNNRKNYYRLSDMIPKHGLHLKVENHKRSTQYRVCIPAETDYVAQDLKDGKEIRDSKLKETCNVSSEVNVVPESSTTECLDQPSEVAWLNEDFTSGEGHNTGDERSPALGMEMVPYSETENPETNEQITVSGISTQVAAPAVCITDVSPIALSVSSQRTVALSSAHTQREIWIMERLERERFVLRSELHKWLEELECRTNSILDRKTVIRNLQRLQRQGRCKCILVSLPGISNYGQMRTVDVVLLPSVEVGPELLSEIYERQRAFDLQIRTQGMFRRKKTKADGQVPTVSGLMRMPKAEVVDKGGGTLQDNGFIPAKLVRCRMLHRFFWIYVTGDIAGNSYTKAVVEHPSTTSSGIFSLLAAVQSMPLELFLQVIGSAKHIKGLTECCRRGMKLSDLPTRESEALLDISASGRVAWLVDILRRLKLLRIVMIPASGESSSTKPQIGVAYALELRPFIDEPGFDAPSSISAHLLNSGPVPRHFFDLSSLENVEEYWRTLEYFFRGTNSAAAKRIFPGSTVPELFGVRSWSSLRLMSMDQRIELQKRMCQNDNKRLRYEECVQIAGDLNLSLDQVLNASYEKNQRIKMQKTVASDTDSFQSEKINIALGKVNSASSDGPVGGNSLEITKLQESSDQYHLNGETRTHQSLMCQAPEVVKRKRAFVGQTEDASEDVEPRFSPEIKVVKKFRPFRMKKFLWKDSLDRVLLACYTRQRALLGARHNRVEWNVIPGLPAPPETCRRRMASFKLNSDVRKSISALCNLLATRYSKFISLKANANIIHDTSGGESFSSCCNSFAWDDFKDPALSAAINDIITCRKAAKPNTSKKVVDNMGLMAPGPGTSELLNSNKAAEVGYSGSSLQVEESSNEIVPSTRNAVPVPARSRPSRSTVRKNLQKPLGLKKISSAEVVRSSMGTAVAVELIKLVFLNSAAESEVSDILVHALRRFRESDIFSAFRFLKDQGMVACGNSGYAFVLSPKFYQNVGFSVFSPKTADDSRKFEAWLRNMKPSLDQEWVILRPDLEWGELFSLFGAVSSGRLSISPFLPEKGIGEKDMDEFVRKRKRDAFNVEDEMGNVKVRLGGTFEKSGFGERRERGFPGIDVKVCTGTMPLEDLIALDSAEKLCLELPAFDSPNPTGSEVHAERGNISEMHNNLELIPFPQADLSNCESLDAVSFEVGGSKSLVGMVAMECWEGSRQYTESKVQMFNFNKACSALSSAGEVGLCLDELAKCIDSDNNEVAPGLYAKVLHSYGYAREVMAFDHTRLVSAPHSERFFLHVSNSGENGAVRMVPILPWLEASGKENDFMRKSLHRRIMGIVMLNPGISEESITDQVDVLNPTSCQKFLELMVLDGHLYTRTMTVCYSASMPKLFQSAFPQNREFTTKRHYYANPASTSLL